MHQFVRRALLGRGETAVFGRLQVHYYPAERLQVARHRGQPQRAVGQWEYRAERAARVERLARLGERPLAQLLLVLLWQEPREQYLEPLVSRAEALLAPRVPLPLDARKQLAAPEQPQAWGLDDQEQQPEQHQALPPLGLLRVCRVQVYRARELCEQGQEPVRLAFLARQRGLRQPPVSQASPLLRQPWQSSQLPPRPLPPPNLGSASAPRRRVPNQWNSNASSSQ